MAHYGLRIGERCILSQFHGFSLLLIQLSSFSYHITMRLKSYRTCWKIVSFTTKTQAIPSVVAIGVPSIQRYYWQEIDGCMTVDNNWYWRWLSVATISDNVTDDILFLWYVSSLHPSSVKNKYQQAFQRLRFSITKLYRWQGRQYFPSVRPTTYIDDFGRWFLVVLKTLFVTVRTLVSRRGLFFI